MFAYLLTDSVSVKNNTRGLFFPRAFVLTDTSPRVLLLTENIVDGHVHFRCY